ncbi:MAG: HIT domain-containing protein [Rickettsiales bacterium]|nr:MAG: HIT domain-containing protein [Rickettsiales bacterium]
MEFKLHQKLEEDSIFILDLELCQLRLINNADYPWLILVPRLENIIEITDLTDTDYLLLNQEIMLVSMFLKAYLQPDKLNIATIGNVVSQMHVHIIARYKDDKTYPKTVWGNEFNRYSKNAENDIINLIRKYLQK